SRTDCVFHPTCAKLAMRAVVGTLWLISPAACEAAVLYIAAALTGSPCVFSATLPASVAAALRSISPTPVMATLLIRLKKAATNRSTIPAPRHVVTKAAGGGEGPVIVVVTVPLLVTVDVE